MWPERGCNDKGRERNVVRYRYMVHKKLILIKIKLKVTQVDDVPEGLSQTKLDRS